MFRSRQGGKRAMALFRRGIASSKHGSKQHKDTNSSGYVRHQPKVEAPVEAPSASMPRPAAPQPPPPPQNSNSASSSWPVDPKLIGVGLAGAGALAYALTGDSTAPPPPKPTTDESTDAAPVISSDAHFSTTVPESMEPEKEAAVVVEETPVAEVVTVITEEQEEAAEDKTTPADASEEPEIVVDSREVLGLIEEVLSKPAETLIDEAAAAVQKAAETIKKEEEEAERRAAETQATQVAITAAISDTAAESVASDIAKAPLGVAAMTPHLHPHHKHPKKDESEAQKRIKEAPAPSSVVTPAVAEALRLLGVPPEAVTPAGLLAEAAKVENATGGTWEEFSYRSKQAEADAAAMAALLSAAAQHVKGELDAARAAAEKARNEADAARSAAVTQAERLRAAAADAVARAERAHSEALTLQAEKLTNAHAEMTVRERAERQARLDELRLRLGALERALERRADSARGATAAHRLAEGAFALQDALSRGGKADAAADMLVAASGGDELVAAALAAVPRGRRIPTPVQLAEEYGDVAESARELSALPAGRGGMLASAAAKIAAKLKLKEREPMASALPGGGGIDAALAAVEAALTAGRLGDAAAALERASAGTAAAPAVAGWVAAARARAAAEQAAAVVEAHAATAALSLA